MAEEFLHGGICGGTWWNLPASRSVFSGCSSPCTAAAVADFGWPTDLQVARDDDNNSNSFATFQWNQSFPPSNSSSTGRLDSPDVAVLKPMNQDFPFDDQQPAVTATSTSRSASYSYPPATTSAAALIQTLFDDDPRTPPQPPVFSGRPINFAGESYRGSAVTATSNDQLSPSSWNKLPPFFRPESFLKQQQQQLPVQFGNEAAFWNAASNGGGGDRFSASSPSEFLRTVFANKPTSCPNTQLLPTKRNGEEAREGSNNNNKKGSGNESPPAVKKARIETPSPLPTFKVRKEKLGDRITALQQLVSPFGKTDTASVLHEAIENIKFLHEQVSVLSTPYMKQGASPNPQMKGGDHHNAKSSSAMKSDTKLEVGGGNQDLRTRGLCLVPISSTFPVATETTVDFWTPAFGATFR